MKLVELSARERSRIHLHRDAGSSSRSHVCETPLPLLKLTETSHFAPADHILLMTDRHELVRLTELLKGQHPLMILGWRVLPERQCLRVGVNRVACESCYEVDLELGWRGAS